MTWLPPHRLRWRTIGKLDTYLEFAEIQAVLAAIDRATPGGRRDHALLVTMYNTGARV